MVIPPETDKSLFSRFFDALNLKYGGQYLSTPKFVAWRKEPDAVLLLKQPTDLDEIEIVFQSDGGIKELMRRKNDKAKSDASTF